MADGIAPIRVDGGTSVVDTFLVDVSILIVRPALVCRALFEG